MSKNKRSKGRGARGNRSLGRTRETQTLRVKARSRRGKGSSGPLRGRMIAGLKIGSVVGLVLLLVFGVRRAVDHLLFESPKFKLAIIDFQSDGHVEKTRVLDACGIDVGMNILRVDLDGARERILEKLPQIRQVEIVRDLPDRLALRVEERHPVAWLGDPGRKGEPQKRRGGLLLDADAVPMVCEDLENRFIELPVIFSKAYANAKPGRAIELKMVPIALDLIAEFGRSFAASPVRLEHIQAANDYSLLGRLNTGSQITFGRKELPRQMGDLQVFLAEATRRGRPLLDANLLVKKNTPVRFGTGTVAVGIAPRAVPVNTLEVSAGQPAAAAESALPRRRVLRSLPPRAPGRSGEDRDAAVRSILRVD